MSNAVFGKNYEKCGKKKLFGVRTNIICNKTQTKKSRYLRINMSMMDFQYETLTHEFWYSYVRPKYC